MLFIVEGFAYRCCKLPQKEYVLKMVKTYTPLKPTVKTVGQRNLLSLNNEPN